MNIFQVGQACHLRLKNVFYSPLKGCFAFTFQREGELGSDICHVKQRQGKEEIQI